MNEMTNDAATTPEKKPFEIPQRWLTIVAGVVLLGIIGAVALSVGLWIKDGSPAVAASFGFRGGPPGGQNRGFQPPPNTGPGGNLGGQGQQPGAPPQQGNNGNNPPNQNQIQPNTNNGALSRQPDFVGSVQGVSGDTLTVRTQGDQRIVRIVNTTVIYRASGSKGTVDDLRQGENVAVVTANAPGALTALEVQLLR